MKAASPLKLLLTGDPGCGKTTVMRKVVRRLEAGTPMRGFLTEEVLEGGRRRGFVGRTLDGRSFLLADRDSSATLRLGPYGVELEGLETLGLASLAPEPDTKLIVLDEVGKMEAFSSEFQRCVEGLLANELPLLATVAAHGVGFVKRVRQDPRVTLLRMRRRGREGLVGEILRRLAAQDIGTGSGRPERKN